MSRAGRGISQPVHYFELLLFITFVFHSTLASLALKETGLYYGYFRQGLIRSSGWEWKHFVGKIKIVISSCLVRNFYKPGPSEQAAVCKVLTGSSNQCSKAPSSNPYASCTSCSNLIRSRLSSSDTAQLRHLNGRPSSSISGLKDQGIMDPHVD